MSFMHRKEQVGKSKTGHDYDTRLANQLIDNEKQVCKPCKD